MAHHDLETLKGIQTYLTENILPVLKGQLASKGAIDSMGILFANRLNNRKLDRPVPLGILSDPRGTVHSPKLRPTLALIPETVVNNPDRGLHSAIRKGWPATHAKGVVLVRQENHKIVLQLEHVDLGDHVWDVTLHNMKTIEKFDEPRAPKELGLKATRFSPARVSN